MSCGHHAVVTDWLLLLSSTGTADKKDCRDTLGGHIQQCLLCTISPFQPRMYCTGDAVRQQHLIDKPPHITQSSGCHLLLSIR